MSYASKCRAIAAASLFAILSACGGGSGSVETPVATEMNVTPTELNAPPLASAGNAQSVFVGSDVTLDGSQSTDADSDALTFAWEMMSRPSGSSATLDDPTGVRPRFTADTAGDYVFQLVVNDGKADSLPATVMIVAAVQNLPPVAQAGAAQNVFTGAVVSLDGTASSDANGDPLTYAWTLATPSGSTAALGDASSATPQFTPDIAGSYVAKLVVSDGQLSSAAATVTVTATVANVAPLANAGPAQTVDLSDTVTLNGSASSDADGDALTYLWSFSSRPGGSTASLSSPTAASPSFTPDLPGTYLLQLIVNDGHVDSAPGTVLITVNPPPPVADAGPDRVTTSNTWIILDGSASMPASGTSTPLTYRWSIKEYTSPYGYFPPMTNPTLQISGNGAGYIILTLQVCQGARCSTDDVTVTIN